MKLSLLQWAGVLIVLTATLDCPAAQGPVYSVVVPTSAAHAGATVEVQLAALNPSASVLVVANPRNL